jgi:uncharacterized membrane protein
MRGELSPSRLEAFSDGVIAVIITIMVLELKVPAHAIGNAAALRQDFPLILVYLLSFIQIGIYWVNHHYLTDDLEQVTHGILWTNLALLFALSLIPWATNWIGERGITSFSAALYCTVFQLPALTWMALSMQIQRRTGSKRAYGKDVQVLSAVLNLAAIPLAYVSPYLALGLIVVVAIRWILPPKLILAKTGGRPDAATEAHR